jgi:hypothetical protein
MCLHVVHHGAQTLGNYTYADIKFLSFYVAGGYALGEADF